MESLLGVGFRETTTGIVEDKSYAQKLVPWLSWDEWELVRASLFSKSPESIALALNRIAAWRSRGCLPATVDVTASIIKIQLKDPVFRPDLSNDFSEDEEILAMLYSMAIMRLVNGLIEKTRQRTVVSIAQAAASISMPRVLIDIRHEASHRELPSLCLLRQASSEALNWLKSYYWDPQMMAIPFRGGVREEIRSKLHQLALGLKKKKSLKSSSSDIKEKRSRKQITRTMKSLVNLYAFYSSEVISTLLEFVLEVPNPLNMHLDSAQTAFQKWKPVITKFSNKEPELLLHLLNAVLDMIEARQAPKDDIGQEQFNICMYEAENCEIGVLSCLFSWLVEIVDAEKSVYCDNIDKELVHRCLGISEPGNSELISSALHLAELIGNKHLQQSLKKLSRIMISTPTPGLDLDFSFESIILDVEEASEKVELLKRRRRLKSKSTRAMNFGGVKWSVVESWKPCPIGMLPGCLPLLDCKSETKETSTLSSIDNEKLKKVSNGKRRASSDIGELNNKRLQVSKHNDNDNDDWSTGRLLINGVFRKVEEEEVKRIQSHIRILAQFPGPKSSTTLYVLVILKIICVVLPVPVQNFVLNPVARNFGSA